MLGVDFRFDVQVATHLKGLAEKAKLNEQHVKIARIYKAKVTSFTSERVELQERVQRMTEEVEVGLSFFNRNWAGACGHRWAGSGSLTG